MLAAMRSSRLAGSTLVRALLAAAPAGASRASAASLSTSATALQQQQKRPQASAADHSDDFAKTPLKPRVASPEAQEVRDLLRSRDFGSLRRRSSASHFAGNNGLGQQGGQSAHNSFGHRHQESNSMQGGHEGSTSS